MTSSAANAEATWVLVDLGGNITDAKMTERVDGAFWLIDGKEIPAPRLGSWPARQAVYRQYGYQLAELKNNTLKLF